MLAFEACSRHDGAEADAIVNNVQWKTYQMLDYGFQRLSTNLLFLSLLYGKEYWRLRALLFYFGTNQVGEPDETCELIIKKMAAIETALVEVCNEVNVAPNSVRRMADCPELDNDKSGNYRDDEMVGFYVDYFTPVK